MKHQLLLPVLLLLVACAPEGEIEATGGWVRAMPPSAGMTAGYLTIENRSARDAAITGAASPDFGSVEIHATVVEDGVSRMLAQDRIALPAHGSVRFEPGGLHLMLMQPTRELAVGDQVQIELQLTEGGTLPITLEVRRDGAAHHQH